MWLLLGVAILAGAALFALLLWAAIYVPAKDGIGSFVIILSSVVALRVSVWVLMANGRDIVDAASGVMKGNHSRTSPLNTLRIDRCQLRVVNSYMKLAQRILVRSKCATYHSGISVATLKYFGTLI
jgi:hypothetical protein